MFDKLIDDMMSNKKSNLDKFVKHDTLLESKVAKKTAAAYEGIDPGEIDNEEKDIKKLEEDFPRRDDEEEMNAPARPDRREEEEEHAPHADGEEEEDALGNDKEYFGKKEDDFFYLETSTEEGESDLRVVDAEGKVVYSARENELDSQDVFHFILQAVPEVEPDDISRDIFTRYIKPEIEELEKQREEEEGGFGGDEQMVNSDPDPMDRRPPRESKNLAELKVVFDDHEFDVNLCEDDSRDTVININGKQFRFDEEFASMYYDDTGVLTEDGLRELAEQILSSLEDEDFETLTPRRTEEKVDLPFELDKVLDEVNLVTQGVKTLRRDAKAAMKNKDYATVAQLTGQLATIHGALPEVDPEPEEAVEAKEEVEESVNEINVVTQGIKQLARATKDALKGGDYASAAQFANSLATIHGALPEIEPPEETTEGVEPDEDKDSEEEKVDKLTEEDRDEDSYDDEEKKELAKHFHKKDCTCARCKKTEEGIDPGEIDNEDKDIKKLEEEAKD
jgi:hypothetical protein